MFDYLTVFVMLLVAVFVCFQFSCKKDFFFVLFVFVCGCMFDYSTCMFDYMIVFFDYMTVFVCGLFGLR